MAKNRKKNTSLCQRAAIILNHDLESYRRGRMPYEDFRSRLQMAEDLNIRVVCKKTGRKVRAVQPGSGRSVTIEERKCSCRPPPKKARGKR